MLAYNLFSEFIISAYGCVSNKITYRDDLKQIHQDVHNEILCFRRVSVIIILLMLSFLKT